MSTPAAGLRERKKQATRQALHEAAVRLAAEHGLENLTVEAVADAAGVSRRTFSNYFEGKEQALLHTDQRRLQDLVALVEARPADEDPWTALTSAVRELLSGAGSDPRWSAQLRLVRNHPALLAGRVAVYGAAERELAGQVAARLPVDPDGEASDRPLGARLLAATVLTMMRVTTQFWFEHPERPATAVLDEVLALAGAGWAAVPAQ